MELWNYGTMELWNYGTIRSMKLKYKGFISKVQI